MLMTKQSWGHHLFQSRVKHAPDGKLLVERQLRLLQFPEAALHGGAAQGTSPGSVGLRKENFYIQAVHSLHRTRKTEETDKQTKN